jgi:MFS family permease
MSVRTDYRHTIYASYIGYVTQAVVNNLPTLLFLTFRDTFGIPLTQITLLITFNFATQLAVDAASAKFVDRIGYRPCIVAAHVFAAAGLIGMAVLPFALPDPFAGLLLSVILYAIGGGLTEVLVSPIVEACPTDNKAGVMSLLHSFYCWGTVGVILLATAFLTFAGRDHWRLLCVLFALIPTANIFYFSLVPIARLTEEGEGMKVVEILRSGLFWLFVALMFASGASEQAMVQWASAFAESGLGVTKAVGDLLGPCLFSVLMGGARVFYAKNSEKIDLVRFLILSGIFCIGTYIAASLSPSPAWSLAACAVCGATVGILWPGVFSVASAAFPRGGTALFAFLALAGDLGCAGGPTTVGFLSGLMGEDLKKGLIFGALFPAVLVVCAAAYRNRGKGRKDS